MSYKNRIRLPFKLTRAQFPEERTSFRKANGEVKTLSVVVRKQYEGETDYFPENWHERLKIALSHDLVRVEGDKYLGNIAQDGEYNIEWPDFLDYPLGKAAFKAQVTPFNNTNSNCMSCEEASQLTLVDDTITGIYGALQEGQSYTSMLADNDNICCYPSVFSVVWFNTDYLTSYAIDPDTGELSITLDTGLTSANQLLLATYRVTCPNGNYDEANVYADVEGSIVGCLAPANVIASTINPDNITFSWDAPGMGTYDYYWEIYEGTLPVGSPVQTGTTTDEFINVTGLDTNTEYYFQVRTVCYGSTSSFSGVATATIPENEICGGYNISFDNGTGLSYEYTVFQYQDCNYVTHNIICFNGSAINICAAQTAPGTPVSLIRTTTYGPEGTVIITYTGLC